MIKAILWCRQHGSVADDDRFGCGQWDDDPCDVVTAFVIMESS